ncbi:MAG: transcription antitermination factor NusB [Thermoguttaceae bacterium]
MRPRTFAREIAFQVLYREDLNPDQPGAVTVYGDALLDQGRQIRELMEFVRHLAKLRDQEDAASADEGESYSQWLRTPSLVEFSRLLIQGVAANRAELDQKLAAAAENWSLPRMAATDRNLLRLGAYEIHFTDTPVKVVIDEAVELAKRFGGAQSAQFVNGILDKLMQQKGNSKS